MKSQRRLSQLPITFPVVLLIALGSPHFAQAGDDGLARLFHTAPERARLDELRANRVTLGDAGPVDTLSVEGIVQRSGGRSTVWINGQPHYRQVPGATVRDNAIRVRNGRNQTIEVKVGETARLTSTPEAQ